MSEENKNELSEQQETAEEQTFNETEQEVSEQTETTENEGAETETVEAEETQPLYSNELGGVRFDEAAYESDGAEQPAKKVSAKVIAAIVAVAVVAAVAVLFIVNGKNWFNPYNKKYVDVTGQTIGDIADQMGMEYSEFLAYYGLPEDMPSSTHERAAYYSMSVGSYAENFAGTDLETLKSAVGWGDEITEDTTLGDALDSMTISEYAGEDNVEAFKAEYDLGDGVTGDTLYGEVRNDIDNYLKAQYEEAQNAENEEQAEVTEEPSAEETAEAEATEAATAAAE